MKKLVALLLVALVLISAPVAASIQFPRQVDPNTAPADQVYGQGLYLFYGSVAAAISGGNFSEASALLKQTPFVHIPAEIADTVDSFDGLINSTSVLFQAVHMQLANASGYIASGRVILAQDDLASAISGLRAANQSLTQLFGAEPQLASLTGIPSSLLLQKLQPLEAVYAGDSAQANRLLSVLTGLSKLDQTAVTLQVAQTSVLAGSNITVAGVLTGPTGAPLPSRSVTVYFGGTPIGGAQTDSSGGYSALLPTPYNYQRIVSVFASYVPTGNDSLAYAPSTSPPVTLTVNFTTPEARLSSPGEAYAGVPFVLEGVLSVGATPLAGYNVSLSGFATSALGAGAEASNSTSPDGAFSVSLTPPSSLTAGTYRLTLQTAGNRTVGPLSVPVQVEVIKEAPAVSSRAPLFAIAGLPFTVSGSAEANGTALSGALVLSTGQGPAESADTSSTGSFSFTVTPPLTTSNGPWNYTLEVYPSQSWINTAPVKVDVFVVNPAVLVFPAGSLGLLGLVVRRRRRAPGQAAELAPQAESAPPEGPRPRPSAGLPGVYFEAVGLVERATSVPLLPQLTVREYFAAVQERLKGAGHFRAISSIIEGHLYAGGAAAGDEERARDELEALRRDIEG